MEQEAKKVLSRCATVTGAEALAFCICWVCANTCMALCGFVKAAGHMAKGLCRPRPEDTRYYLSPYSVWKGLFMGHVWELALARRGQQPRAKNSAEWGDADLKAEIGARAGEGDGAADTEAAGMRDVLRKAAESTRASITSELTANMTVCSLIAGFMFTKLVDPPQWRRGVHNDLFGLFAGLAFVLALVNIGVCSRLVALLHWSATASSLYYVIAVWERAMSANQLNFVLVIICSFAAAMSACAAPGQAPGSTAGSPPAYSTWVVVTLGAVGGVALWLFLYFWAAMMWSRRGVYAVYRRLFMKRMCDVDTDSIASYDEAQKTLFWLIDRELLSHLQKPSDRTPCCKGASPCCGPWQGFFDDFV